MTGKYKGFEIYARREEDVVWGAAVRLSDRWVLYEGCDIASTLSGTVKYLKELVDKYLENPGLYED